MKLCFSTLGCPEWDVWKIADKAKEYGFEGVELRARGDKHIDVTLTKEERAKILAHYKERGIKIVCLAGYGSFNKKDPEDIAENRKMITDYIDLAVDVEADYIRTFIGNVNPENITREEVEKIAVEELNILGKLAAEKGVKIIIETHDAFGTGKKVRNIMKDIDNEGVAVLWDVAHSIHEDESIEETYAMVGSKVVHMHLKDSYVDNEGKEKHCLVGEGEIPLKEIVELMKGKGFDGYYSLEWEKFWVPEMEEPEIAFPIYVDYMRSVDV